MSTNLVSVIIPAYNHENYIQDSINSIINQTYQNIELIIIDDGSSDSTWEKIQEMKETCEARFSNTIFLKQTNSGTCKTLNNLFKIANGEFVYLIASDDIAKPQAIELEINEMLTNPKIGLVVGDNEIIDFQGKQCYLSENTELIYDKNLSHYQTFVDFLKTNHPWFESDKFGLYETLLLGNYIPNGYLIRKKFLNLIPPFTTDAPLEDWYLMLQLSKYCYFKYIDKPLFSYRRHSKNTSQQTKKMINMTIKTGMHEEKILNTINIKEVLPELKPLFENNYFLNNNSELKKQKGIKNLFEILTYKKFGTIYKELRLFGIKILGYFY